MDAHDSGRDPCAGSNNLAGSVPVLVSLSGGNPALQPLAPLVELGHRKGYTFTLETQGSVPPALVWPRSTGSCSAQVAVVRRWRQTGRPSTTASRRRRKDRDASSRSWCSTTMITPMRAWRRTAIRLCQFTFRLVTLLRRWLPRPSWRKR